MLTASVAEIYLFRQDHVSTYPQHYYYYCFLLSTRIRDVIVEKQPSTNLQLNGCLQ